MGRCFITGWLHSLQTTQGKSGVRGSAQPLLPGATSQDRPDRDAGPSVRPKSAGACTGGKSPNFVSRSFIASHLLWVCSQLRLERGGVRGPLLSTRSQLRFSGTFCLKSPPPTSPAVALRHDFPPPPEPHASTRANRSTCLAGCHAKSTRRGYKQAVAGSPAFPQLLTAPRKLHLEPVGGAARPSLQERCW